MQLLEQIFTILITLFENLFEFLVGIIGSIPEKNKGYKADFISESKLLSSYFNKGFNLTGRKNLSVKNSYQNAICIGSNGTGKSSVVLVPSLFSTKGSFIVNDPSGELFTTNDATLFAMIDAHKAFKKEISDIRLLSVGVGQFIEKPLGWKYKLLRKVRMIKFVERVLSANTNTTVLIAKLLFPDLKMVRVSDTFNEPEYGTNMIERDNEKLKKLNQLGRNSFAKYEKEIENLLNITK
jgi:hypothetical protein